MIARKTLDSSPGGDTIQIRSTAKYLQELNVHVDIYTGGSDIKYSNYDLLHFFNIIRPDDILPHILNCKIPFVISTIFVDYFEYEKSRDGLLGWVANKFSSDKLEYIKAVARFIKNGDKINSKFYLFRGHKASVEFVSNRASLLLPNSHSEHARFKLNYSTSTKYIKVPNAIDKKIFDDSIIPNYEYKNHVLCVGRIEGRKNQLNLIKALNETDLFLTIIGKPSPNHIDYYNQCLDLVSKNDRMRIIEHIDHQELASIFLASKVHVLPSWFETTGLSSLEAAVMDCNVVITDYGDTEEYFKNMAFYCQPDDINSIRQAVLKAYDAPVDGVLKREILSSYTWQQAAQATLSAYELVLNKNFNISV